MPSIYALPPFLTLLNREADEVGLILEAARQQQQALASGSADNVLAVSEDIEQKMTRLALTRSLREQAQGELAAELGSEPEISDVIARLPPETCQEVYRLVTRINEVLLQIKRVARQNNRAAATHVRCTRFRITELLHRR